MGYNNNRWSEVKCDYCDDGFWRVDAWETDDSNEEGTVIAFVDDLTGRVLYNDPVARVDSLAQEVIHEKVHDIKYNNKVLVMYSDLGVELHLKTSAGSFIASTETPEITGCHEDGMYIGLDPLNDGEYYNDVSCVRAMGPDHVRINVWADPRTDDNTHSFDLDVREYCALPFA